MIQSVDRAVRIMSALADARGRLGVSEIAAQLGLPKGTVHGLLRTLQAHGLVEKHGETDKYQLGPTLLRLSNAVLDVNELRSRSHPWAELLAIKTHESVRVAAPHATGVLIVHHVFRPDETMQILDVGALLPAHATALGKAVLAYLGPEEQTRLLGGGLIPLTGRTLTDAKKLAAALDQTRSRGYALEIEEAVVGEAAIAAPIFDRQREITGSIGIAAPLARLDASKASEQVSVVVDAARAISRELGAPSWPL
jgi:DNA-binding IclR family transcriptional regulator